MVGAARAESDFRSTDIEAKAEWLQTAGRPLLLSAYANQVPGALIEARPGDRLRINFTNRLNESTNLHFHGLHVPPTGNADNSFLEIRSGSSMVYELDLPQNHPGGTFWYHPHHHGLTAKQLSRGLAGPIIIRGALDEIPEIGAAPEKILMLQDFEVNGRGEPLEPTMMERMQGREGNLVLVSGVENPVLAIQRRGWLRLRIVNASTSRFYRLKLDEHPLYQIASDGGALPEVQERDEILLSPGERAEVMVRGAREPGEYHLRTLPYNRGQMGMMGMMGGPRPSTTGPIATLRYDGDAETEWTLPSALVPIQPLPAPAVFRSFRLGENMMNFTINGRTFDGRRTDAVVGLNTIEEWEFDNPTDMDHPMHIHTNAFQVIDSSGVPVLAWKDVVLVRSRAKVRVRMRFDDFAGPTLFHCHILDHEDLGMMARFDIRA
jgi:FtsP/CotA-like multicopper oxidase with cupredoxin domain